MQTKVRSTSAQSNSKHKLMYCATKPLHSLHRSATLTFQICKAALSTTTGSAASSIHCIASLSLPLVVLHSPLTTSSGCLLPRVKPRHPAPYRFLPKRLCSRQLRLLSHGALQHFVFTDQSLAPKLVRTQVPRWNVVAERVAPRG